MELREQGGGVAEEGLEALFESRGIHFPDSNKERASKY